MMTIVRKETSSNMYLELGKNTENVLGAIRSGYGGIFANGALADRRFYPFIKPLPEDESLGIPAPKEVVRVENSQEVILRKEEAPNFVLIPLLMLQALSNLSGAPDRLRYEQLLSDSSGDTERLRENKDRSSIVI